MYMTERLFIHKLSSDCSLVINAITGQLHLLSSFQIAALSTLRRGSRCEDQQVLNDLRSLHLVFDSPESEESCFRAACHEGHELYLTTARRSYVFVINAHCNFDCVY